MSEREPVSVSWVLGVAMVVFLAVAAFGWLLGFIPEQRALMAMGVMVFVGFLLILISAL